MKVSKRLSIKHRVVKSYNEKHRFIPPTTSATLGETPYRNLLIAGTSNTFRTTLGLSILVNHVRNNPRLRLGQPNYVYLTNMEAPVGLLLWEFIQGRAGYNTQISEAITKRAEEIYTERIEDTPVDLKHKRLSTAQYFLEEERIADVKQWFLDHGYTLKISDRWSNKVSELLTNVRIGRSVICYNDNITALDCERNIQYSWNCLHIGVAQIYNPKKINGEDRAFTAVLAVRPYKALLIADRAVECDVAYPEVEGGQSVRKTTRLKNRGGWNNDPVTQDTTELVNALIR